MAKTMQPASVTQGGRADLIGAARRSFSPLFKKDRAEMSRGTPTGTTTPGMGGQYPFPKGLGVGQNLAPQRPVTGGGAPIGTAPTGQMGGGMGGMGGGELTGMGGGMPQGLQSPVSPAMPTSTLGGLELPSMLTPDVERGIEVSALVRALMRVLTEQGTGETSPSPLGGGGGVAPSALGGGGQNALRFA